MSELARVFETEAALRNYPNVQDAVVTVDGDAESRRLLRYVLRGTPAAEQTTTEQAHMSAWQDSFTVAPIPRAEMRKWAEETVERMRALEGRTVRWRSDAELGCY